MSDLQPLWALTVIGGPVILAIVIAYALLSRRRLTPHEKQRQDAATRRLYDENNRDRS